MIFQEVQTDPLKQMMCILNVNMDVKYIIMEKTFWLPIFRLLVGGHNILKSLGKELCNIEYNIDYCDYDYLYRALYNQGTILYIMENDEEIEFRFYSKYIDLISKYLQPQTSGASIDPFSIKNLPKSNYKIPLSDIETYKNIIVSVENKLLISRITQDFIGKIIGKDAKFKEKNMSQEMKKQMLRGKEFIHSNGYWKQYIIYLQEGINNEKSCKI